jgi:hypothetical protein
MGSCSGGELGSALNTHGQVGPVSASVDEKLPIGDIRGWGPWLNCPANGILAVSRPA